MYIKTANNKLFHIHAACSLGTRMASYDHSSLFFNLANTTEIAGTSVINVNPLPRWTLIEHSLITFRLALSSK